MYLQRFAGERTEPATPRRRTEARRKGQVVRSAEAASALLLLAAFLAIKMAGPGMVRQLAGFTQEVLSNFPRQDWTAGQVAGMFLSGLWVIARVVAPVVLATAGVGLITEVVQVGWAFNLGLLRMDFGRLNPAAGVARMFSRRSAFELLKSVAKAAMLSYVAYTAVRQESSLFPRLAEMELPQIASAVGELMLTVLWKVGVAMLVIAAVDYSWVRQQFEASIRMSKEEIKEETRETEGNPQVRSRIRQRQQVIARRRMMEAVKRADVVVANPVHFAVALKYEAGKMAAPQVVGKGQGYLAQKIKEVARENGVTVVENPPLARALYDAVEVGRSIPAELYQAVAEVLAFVYRLKGRA